MYTYQTHHSPTHTTHFPLLLCCARGEPVFFSYIFYFILENKKRHSGRRREHLSGYSSVLLFTTLLYFCFTLFCSWARQHSQFFFIFVLNPLGPVLQLGRERELIYLQPSVGQEKAEPTWKRKKKGQCSSMRTRWYKQGEAL